MADPHPARNIPRPGLALNSGNQEGGTEKKGEREKPKEQSDDNLRIPHHRRPCKVAQPHIECPASPEVPGIGSLANKCWLKTAQETSLTEELQGNEDDERRKAQNFTTF